MDILSFSFGAFIGLILGTLGASVWLSRQLTRLGAQLSEKQKKEWSEESRTQLFHLLEPFRDRLKDFEKKVEEISSFERTERGSLRGELAKLFDLNIKMSQEAQNLSRALKGDVRVQGNWGEILLENILERSGLRKDEEFVVQKGSVNSLGESIRPDILIRLPEGKHLIIDSKVSLTAFYQHSQADTDEARAECARAHSESLRKHIDSLAAKKYSSGQDFVSPDFVLLFLPLEPAFSLAFQTRPELFSQAWDQNIALVSPTTLLATLKTVASLWKHERQQKNALEIAKRGGALYDKFAGFIKDLEAVGEKIQMAQKSFDLAMNKLATGNGSLVSQAEKLRELGAKTEKRLGIKNTEENSDKLLAEKD
jgi:DNA recombination protein RmuC